MLTLLIQSELAEYYQVKNLTREVDLTRGQFMVETAKIQVAVKRAGGPKYFDYSIPFEFYGKISSTAVKVGGYMLETQIVVSNNAFLPVFYLRAHFNRDFTDAETFYMTVSYTAIVNKFENKYTSLFTNESMSAYKENSRSHKDRTLVYRFASLAGLPVDVTTQTLQIKTPLGQTAKFDTETTPHDIKSSQITIGPMEYAPLSEVEYVKVTYYAEEPTMEVTSKREVVLSGAMIKIGADESYLGLAHIVDTLHFKNLDPAPRGLRRSRIDIAMLKSAPRRAINDITIVIPKAKNIKVYDRTGKVASRQILYEESTTRIVVKPRIELFGQDEADIILEYDTLLAYQSQSDYGIILPAAPKIQPVSFYKSFDVCLYPPMQATDIQFYSQQPLEFSKIDSKQVNFDFKARYGSCASFGFSDLNIAGKDVGMRWQLDYSVLYMRFYVVAIAVFAITMLFWFARVLFKF